MEGQHLAQQKLMPRESPKTQVQTFQGQPLLRKHKSRAAAHPKLEFEKNIKREHQVRKNRELPLNRTEGWKNRETTPSSRKIASYHPKQQKKKENTKWPFGFFAPSSSFHAFKIDWKAGLLYNHAQGMQKLSQNGVWTQNEPAFA